MQDSPLVVPSVILTFRWNSSGLAPGAAERGEQLAAEAEALGATLCAFGPFEISFAFGESDLEEAATFASSCVKDKGELGRAGMAFGDIGSFLEGSGFVRLAYGAPIVLATALARFAQPGEVVVDATLAGGSLRFTGPSRDVTLGGKPRPTFVLDLDAPLRDASFDGNSRGEPEELHVDRDSAPAFEVRESDTPPPQIQHLLDLANEALTRSDHSGLDDALAQLNLADEHADAVERLAGVLAMGRGAKEEGLRVLRRAAASEQSDDKRTRAVLAYAIGVAAAGRQDDALLEGLSALAIARARNDKGGEKACARFLAQLSYGAGHVDAASAWEHVARSAEPEG